MGRGTMVTFTTIVVESTTASPKRERRRTKPYPLSANAVGAHVNSMRIL